MNEFNITLGIEPVNKYDKARKAVLEAANAISELSPAEKEMLAREIFGRELVSAMYKMMQEYF